MFIIQVKILLPTHIHSRHHIVFTFYHVSCEIKVERGSKVLAKKAHQGETVVGYAWFPLLDDKGRYKCPNIYFNKGLNVSIFIWVK